MNQLGQTGTQGPMGYVPIFLSCKHQDHSRGVFKGYETQGGVKYAIYQCPGCGTRSTTPVKPNLANSVGSA